MLASQSRADGEGCSVSSGNSSVRGVQSRGTRVVGTPRGVDVWRVLVGVQKRDSRPFPFPFPFAGGG